MSQPRLNGKVAIVTGAAMGLGEAIARRFAEEGARVVCVDVRRSPTTRSSTRSEMEGGEASLSRRASRRRRRPTAAEITSSASAASTSSSTTPVSSVLETVPRPPRPTGTRRAGERQGRLLMSRAVLPAMIAQGGAPVNLSSITGVVGLPVRRLLGVEGAGPILTKQMAVDGQHGIRVSALSPSFRSRASTARCSTGCGRGPRGATRSTCFAASASRVTSRTRPCSSRPTRRAGSWRRAARRRGYTATDGRAARASRRPHAFRGQARPRGDPQCRHARGLP